MKVTNRWALRSGFGAFVQKRPERTEPPTVQITRDADTGELCVLKPEMIAGMLLEMATGDENMPKGGRHQDVFESDDDAVNMYMCGKRSGWKRKRGEYGEGAYKDEPWSLQAMEKRV